MRIDTAVAACVRSFCFSHTHTQQILYLLKIFCAFLHRVTAPIFQVTLVLVVAFLDKKTYIFSHEISILMFFFLGNFHQETHFSLFLISKRQLVLIAVHNMLYTSM